MKKKTDFSIAFLKQFEEFVPLRGERFHIVESGKFLLKAIDCNNADFYFIVEEKDERTFFEEYIVVINPSSDTSTTSSRRSVSLDCLNIEFEQWIDRLNQYDSLVTFLDDPIAQSYAENYYADFKIIEPDKPLEPDKVLLLDEWLANLEEQLPLREDEENKEKIAAIVEETKNLRKVLTQTGKGKIFQKLANILAKITVLGPKYIREFVMDVTKQLIVSTTINLIQNF
jgi:hypothetical protein